MKLSKTRQKHKKKAPDLTQWSVYTPRLYDGANGTVLSNPSLAAYIMSVSLTPRFNYNMRACDGFQRPKGAVIKLFYCANQRIALALLAWKSLTNDNFSQNFHWSYLSNQHQKTCFEWYVACEGSDQTVHLMNLIWVFAWGLYRPYYHPLKREKLLGSNYSYV